MSQVCIFTQDNNNSTLKRDVTAAQVVSWTLFSPPPCCFLHCVTALAMNPSQCGGDSQLVQPKTYFKSLSYLSVPWKENRKSSMIESCEHRHHDMFERTSVQSPHEATRLDKMGKAILKISKGTWVSTCTHTDPLERQDHSPPTGSF